jgi:hypothetical protein
LIDTTMVLDNRFYRLLTEAEGNGETYSIQLFFNSMEEFEQYENQKFNHHLELMYAKYPGKFVEFRSILATVKPL